MDKSIIKLLIVIIGILCFIIYYLTGIKEINIKTKTDTGRNYNNILELKK